MPETIVFIHGKPGAGKSSCCESALKEAETWGGAIPVRHLSVGERFRGILHGKINSIYDQQVQSFVSNSSAQIASMDLPAAQLVHAVVQEYIGQLNSDGITLVDGYPKEPEMLPLIIQAQREKVLKTAGCILVAVSDDTAVHRQMSRAASDNHPEYSVDTAIERVAYHNNHVVPVMETINTWCAATTVDGESEQAYAASAFVHALRSYQFATGEAIN